LIDLGHQVSLLCRSREGLDFMESECVRIVEGDLLDIDALRKGMDECDQVYHLAGLARVWARDASMFYEINVRGTSNVLEAAVRNQVKRVVFCSSGSTFGPSNGQPVTESTIRSKGFYNEYEASKFVAEERALRYVLKGLDVMIVHPCRVYGPGVMTPSNALSRIIKGCLDGSWHTIPGTGNSIGCYSFIDDVVHGMLAAMESGRPGERYILGGHNISFNQLFDLIQRISGRDLLLFRVHLWLIKTLGLQEEIRAKFSSHEPLITRAWLRRYGEDNSCSSEKAVRELGYPITPIEEGLKTTIEWIQNQYL
jgi:farnesol dehydrogenase